MEAFIEANKSTINLISLIIFLVAAIIISRFLGRYVKNNRETGKVDFSRYQKNNFLYTNTTEFEFYKTLIQVVGNHFAVQSQVGMGSLFIVKTNNQSTYRSLRNKIESKRIDFLLCDPQTMAPVLAIELDGSSHQRVDRVERDIFVNQLFATTRFPLLRYPARNKYDPADMAQRIKNTLSQSTTKK